MPRRRLSGQGLSALVAFVFCLIPLAFASAFDLKINGTSLALPGEARLRELTYAVPARAGSARGYAARGYAARGIALADLLPPLIEAWRLDCAGRGGSAAWTGEDLADRLSDFLLLQGPAGEWDLQAPDKTISALRSIELRGEVAKERPLEVWLSWEGVPELKKEIERWAELSGVQVKAIEVPDTRSKLLAVARGGGRMPDLFMLQSDNLPDLLAAQIPQPLDRIDARYLSARGNEAFTTEGKRWALPFYFDTQLLFYNKARIGTAPPLSWTTDDLESLAANSKSRGRPSLSWNVYSAYWLLSFASGFGKPAIADADGGVRPDDAGTKRALAWIMSLIERGLLDPLERDAMVARFASGDLAMILSGSYSIPEFERIGLDFGVAPYPLVASTGRPIAPLLDFKGFAMGRTTQSPVSARRLLDYLTGLGVQQRFSAALSKLPANTEAWALSKTSNRYYAQLERSAEIGLVIPPSAAYSVYKNTMWKILRFILSGSMKPDEALAEARRLIDANLAGR